jgi:hypothetical protein
MEAAPLAWAAARAEWLRPEIVYSGGKPSRWQ